jgi:hypothetical protein
LWLHGYILDAAMCVLIEAPIDPPK